MNFPTFQIIYLVPYHDAVPIHNMGTGPEVFQGQARHRIVNREKAEEDVPEIENQAGSERTEVDRSGAGAFAIEIIKMDKFLACRARMT
jgi:hypothetical protein